MDRLSILMITPEYAPFAKVGGLADMVAALSLHLCEEGHDVRVVLPFYRQIKEGGYKISAVLNSLCVNMGNGEEWCSLWKTISPTGVTIYLIEHNLFFNRPGGLYSELDYQDYQDNPRRFGFFSRAALQVAIDTGFSPDIVHAHDWQTALATMYIKTWFWNDPFLGRSASVLTIHNEAYQGIYPADNNQWLGIKSEHFLPNILEDYGKTNFLKGGIYFSDIVNTVSPTHAVEMKKPFGSFGLAPFVNNKKPEMTGILNGVDYSVWSPENDRQIPYRFSQTDLTGKTLCKKQLQQEFLLTPDNNCALIGIIGRFTEQKGFHLLKECIEKILNNMAVQFIILGCGEQYLEHYFGQLPARYSGRVGSFIGFNNYYAHLIEAGSDFFLMPSLFEPCGLNQMYSLRYGTLPIVRSTGGLNDTVENYDELTGNGTGFKFSDPTPEALYNTIGWAISTYYDRPSHINSLIKTAMQQDFSWSKSTQKYLKLYTLARMEKDAYDKKNII